MAVLESGLGAIMHDGVFYYIYIGSVRFIYTFSVYNIPLYLFQYSETEVIITPIGDD